MQKDHVVTSETIDHITLAHLVEAHAVREAQAVAQAGGWGIVIKYGTLSRPLRATRSGDMRVFKKLDTLVRYLKDIGIHHFNVDAADYDRSSMASYKRPDASAAMRAAHAAAANDKRMREQIDRAVAKADQPDAKWISNDVVKAESAARRVALRSRATTT